jgi:hypothetical protein
MSAPATTPAPAEPAASQFVQMTDDEAAYHEEVEILEKRGRRLRRAALAAGIFQAITIVCTIYTTITVRWVLIEWMQPEKTAYEITESIGLYKLGIFSDCLVTVTDTIVGVLLGMILIGAGVNPATSGVVIVFKLIQQAIMGANVVFLIGAGLLLDENLANAKIITQYFYSDNQPPIGTQVAYLLLLLNKYGHIFAQVFAGIHFGLLGFSVIMWGVFPRYMGYLLFIAGPCLIVNSALYLLWPGYDGQLSLVLCIPVGAAAFWLSGWLLVNTPHPAKNRELFFSPAAPTPAAQPAAQTQV